ncbi:hypothetical protein SAMN05428989_0781 [Pseudoxanthomonas sp. GM95]|uniref:hypothetical protein n=1 Tax=Pseudoxanthomonas sp. GM95 TaxID=1881043 RepID=UPI0008BACC83|nr:hypothetical protein [Pseudoxanthomonas sp. GM95]SEK77829.1 hypothetical protein SAMN05428989_0781 [Pseudoxanthomonas sp. GM95]
MASSSASPPWKKKNPVKPAARVTLTDAQKAQAKARAEAAGRRYPNLVDNMYVARQAKDGGQ